MWRDLKRIGLGLLVVGVLVGLIMSTWSSAPKAAAPTIKLGLMAPRTGKAAYYGEGLAIMIKMLEKFNAEGGIKSMGGAKFEWVLSDTESNPEKVIGEMERLVKVKNVDAIVSIQSSPEAMAGLTAYDRLKVPHLTTVASSEDLFKAGSKWWCSVSLTSDDIGNRAADTAIGLIEEYGVKHDRIVIVTCDSEQPIETYAQLMKRLRKAGLDKNIVLDTRYPFKPTEAILSSVILKAKNANPDIMIVNNLAGNAPLWYKMAYELGFYPPVNIECVSWLAQPRIWKDLPEKMVMEQIATRPVFGYNICFDEIDYKPFQEFRPQLEAWCKELGRPRSVIELLIAQQALIVKEIYEKAGTKDKEVVNKVMHEEKIPFGSPNMILPGWYPFFKFGPGGKPLNGRLYAMQWQGKRCECIYPKKLRTAKPVLPSKVH